MQKVRGRPRTNVAPCKVCNKQFKRQEHLLRHERTHTQEKPFSCYCGRIFSRKDLLGRHQRGSHRERASQPPVEGEQRDTSLTDNSNGDGRSKHGEEQTAWTGSTHDTQHVQHPISTSSSAVVRRMISNNGIPLEDASQESNAECTNSIAPIIRRSNAPFLSENNFTTELDKNIPPDFLQDVSVDFGFFWDDIDFDGSFFQSSSSGDAQLLDSPSMFSGEGLSLIEPSSNLIQARGASTAVQPSESTQTQESKTEESGAITARDLKVPHEADLSLPWTVSPERYKTICDEFAQCRHPLPVGFVLPGRQTLSRYLEGYFRTFHPHLPFLHLPTASPDHMSVRLISALAAVGAFYRFEHPQGYALYLASRAIIEDHLEEERHRKLFILKTRYPAYAQNSTPESSTFTPTDASGPDPEENGLDLETMQALLVLIQLTVWIDKPAFQDGFSMIGWLSMLVRSALPLRSPKVPPIGWKEWCCLEELRRTLYCVFITSNLITVCYNHPPIITNLELDFPLPCCVAEWKAFNEGTWKSGRRQGTLQHLTFQQCFLQILKGKRLDKEISVTAFGNYLLIHGLLQQLYFDRRSSHALLSETSSLPETNVKRYKEALVSWQSSWESTPESTLDPSSPHGPLGFNSTAIFRLVHVRLSVDLTKRQMFDYRDPITLACAFTDGTNPVSLRMLHVESAVLQCIHVLRIVVRAGVVFVARTRTNHWSVQHAISSFECAMLLTRWLQSVAVHVDNFGFASLNNDEKLLLKTLTELIEETHLVNRLGGEEDPGSRILRLAADAVELWAESCKTVHVFEIVHAIGKTLSCVAKQLHDRAATKRSG